MYELTAEQQAAVSLFQTGESLAIEAGAGTGKTSTLISIGQSTERRGQYLAFNRSIVDEAKLKMPANVAASTAHSLAFRAVGKRFSHRLPPARMRGDQIARLLQIDPLTLTIRTGETTEARRLSPGYLAGLVTKAIKTFCNTADAAPSVDHFPYIDGIDEPRNDKRGWDNNREVRRFLAPALQRAWADLTDPHGTLPYSHDCYLKLWERSEPVIPVEFILFDEAQDASPVMLSIVLQQGCQVVWVGDSQQQIYDWRGAVNALATVGQGHKTYLTGSFRFGPAIANIANVILSRIDGAELRLSGLSPVPSTVAATSEPRAILTRTNAGAISLAIKQMHAGRKVHLMGGGKEIAAFCRAAKDLMADPPRRTEHPELACFASWSEVEDYANVDPNGDELRLMVRLINEYSPEGILRVVDSSCPEGNADVVISTAHKAKGREWDSVQLGSDFTAPKGGGDISDPELRLLYVAATRAQVNLDVSVCGALAYLLEGQKESLDEDEEPAPEQPVVTPDPRCPACHEALSYDLRPGDGCPCCGFKA